MRRLSGTTQPEREQQNPQEAGNLHVAKNRGGRNLQLETRPGHGSPRLDRVRCVPQPAFRRATSYPGSPSPTSVRGVGWTLRTVSARTPRSYSPLISKGLTFFHFFNNYSVRVFSVFSGRSQA